MEQEYFISGYCRRMDQSRMVTLVTENAAPVQIDCDFGNCPYEQNCPVAREIRDQLK
jgi:hypothetical protein